MHILGWPPLFVLKLPTMPHPWPASPCPRVFKQKPVQIPSIEAKKQHVCHYTAGQQVRPYADWKGCNYEYGMDHIGSDGYVGTYYARSEQECCQMCFYDVRCRAPRASL